MAEREEHPFAEYLKIIGKGPTLSRPLNRQEACTAFEQVTAGTVLPEQLGAFLLLLRYRGETPDELAGFVDAARKTLDVSTLMPPDLDWPSYADRHRQQPWFVLSAMLLAQNGLRILMHGISGEHENHAPTRPALQAMGIPISTDLLSATKQFHQTGLAYIGLESFLPSIENLFHLRPVLGVRTLVNTFARAINPLKAPYQIQGVVHPPYREAHRDVALLLDQPACTIFKGGGGEGQRNPLKVCRTLNVRDGSSWEEEWSASEKIPSYDWRSEPLQPERLKALWDGDISEPAAEAAVVATTAIGLRLVDRAASPSEADDQAQALWHARKPWDT